MKQSLQLGTLSLANIGGLFLFQWYVLTRLGPGNETDAFFASTTLTQLVIMVISGALMHVLVPLLAGEDEDRLRQDAWGFLVLVAGVFLLLAIVLYVAAPWIIPVIVPGFNDTTKELVVHLTRIQLIGMVFVALNGVQWATYHARQRFVWAEFAPVLSGIVSLLTLAWALPRFGVVSAAWVSAAGACIQTLLLAPGMGKPVKPQLKSAAIRAGWKRIKPLLLGMSYYRTDTLVDRFLLSAAASGSLSLYYLAQQIYGGICQVLNKALAAPLVPALSRLHKSGDSGGFQRLYRRKLLQVLMVSSAVLMLVAVFGQLLLNLLVGYGNVSAANVVDLWWIMLWLGGVLVGGAAGQVCATTFYACGDTTTPTRMSIVTYTVYIPCKVVAFYNWGVMGLAMVTTVYYMANLSLQVLLLRRKLA